MGTAHTIQHSAHTDIELDKHTHRQTKPRDTHTGRKKHTNTETIFPAAGGDGSHHPAQTHTDTGTKQTKTQTTKILSRHRLSDKGTKTNKNTDTCLTNRQTQTQERKENRYR